MNKQQNITTKTDSLPKQVSGFPLSGGSRGAWINWAFDLARAAGERYNVNPVVILAQAALESGWGDSTLAKKYNNYFGITAYGRENEFWNGESVELGKHSLKFRIYESAADSFMDFARLIASAYPKAAAMSFNPEAFAAEIASSKYISEVNGDNRQAYRKALAKICKQIEPLVQKDPLTRKDPLTP